MNKDATPAKIANALVVAILVLLPFHAVFTTWLGSNFGHLDLFRIWKELLLIPIGLISLYIMLTTPEVKRRVGRSWLFWLVIAYIALTIGMGLWAHSRLLVNSSALLFGLLANLRFVTLLIFAWIIALKSPWLYSHWREILLGPALLVVAFGILQWLVLPANFLAHFGYGPHTIPAIQTVDAQSSFRRLQSTLRGANPLGAYLILVVTAFVGTVITQTQRRGTGIFLVIASSTLLFLTYSRSAYLGALLSVAVLLWFLLPQVWPKKPWRKWLGLAAAVVVIVAALGIFSLRHNSRIEDIAFHSSQQSTSGSSSNATRTSALEQGLKDVRHRPLGSGTGTAGPASVRNNGQARIAENYYIQIAQEVGIIGLALFLAINLIVACELYRRRGDVFALLLLASLVGISFVNLVSHAWSDDTLSMIWWGLAGVAIAQPLAKTAILDAKNKRHTRGQSKVQKKAVKTS